MVAIELFGESEIQIYKDASTKELKIKAINHFSTGELTDKITDNTLKLFLLIVGSIIFIAVVIAFVMKIIAKFSKKDKKHTTFDAIDGAMIQDDLKNHQYDDDFRDGSNLSDLTDFKFGQENPNDISDIFMSTKEQNTMSNKPNASLKKRDGGYGRVKSSQKHQYEEVDEEEEKLA